MVDEVTAVIDRIDNGIATLLVEPDGTAVKLRQAALPAEAAEGDVVTVDALDPTVVVALDRDAGSARRSAAARRMKELGETRSSGRFEG